MRGGDQNFAGAIPRAGDVRGRALERNRENYGSCAVEGRSLRKRPAECQRLDMVVLHWTLAHSVSWNASHETDLPSISISRWLGSMLGLLRFAASADELRASAVARIGSASVASACTVTCAASAASLPQLCASSSDEPDAPPKCGTSVTICSAYRCPPTRLS